MLPLTGVKVVEFANNIAGPYAGFILAMLGADVLKIERPEGVTTRAPGARRSGRTRRRRSSASTSTRRASRSTSRRPTTSPG